MTDRAQVQAPAAVAEHAYGTWLWLDERVAGFPTHARRQLGHRLLDAILDALTGTVEACYEKRGPARTTRLRDVNRTLALARILFRGARDRHHVSVGQHEHGMRLIDDWGRQVGGWLRAEEG